MEFYWNNVTEKSWLLKQSDITDCTVFARPLYARFTVPGGPPHVTIHLICLPIPWAMATKNAHTFDQIPGGRTTPPCRNPLDMSPMGHGYQKYLYIWSNSWRTDHPTMSQPIGYVSHGPWLPKIPIHFIKSLEDRPRHYVTICWICLQWAMATKKYLYIWSNPWRTDDPTMPQSIGYVSHGRWLPKLPIHFIKSLEDWPPHHATIHWICHPWAMATKTTYTFDQIPGGRTIPPWLNPLDMSPMSHGYEKIPIHLVKSFRTDHPHHVTIRWICLPPTHAYQKYLPV
jgi:hypothetical protein